MLKYMYMYMPTAPYVQYTVHLPGISSQFTIINLLCKFSQFSVNSYHSKILGEITVDKFIIKLNKGPRSIFVCDTYFAVKQ